MSFSLSGIASGIDTNAIISQLMQIERIPYNKLQNTRNAYNSQLSVFRTINTKLMALRSAAEDLRLSAAFSLRSASVSDNSVLRVSASDTAAEGVYEIYVDSLAKAHSVRSASLSSALSQQVDDFLDGASNQFKIYYGDKEETFTFSGETVEEALNNLVKAINGKDIGLTAALVETSPGAKTLVLTAKKTGTDHDIRLGSEADGQHVVIDADQAFLEKLGLVTVDEMTSAVEWNTVTEAKNARITINGLEIIASGNELSNVLAGVNLTLLKEGASASVTIARDADKVADKVEAFVKAYNDVIAEIRSSTAKGAALQGDFTLRSLEDQLAAMLHGGVGPNTEGERFKYEFLVQVGLEVDKGITKGSDMTGKISFDREKFKKALAEDPDAVYRLFAHQDETPGARQGIAERFSETLRVWTRSGTGILAAKIEGFNEQINFVTKQMESMESRLAQREEQLRKRFSNMEVALASLQNQMAWLNSQLAALMVSQM